MATNRFNGGVFGRSVENSGNSLANTQTFTGDSTWVKNHPAVTLVDVFLAGGGGGGKGSHGGGGGGGGYRTIIDFPISADTAVTVGAAGAGGYPGPEPTNGGDSILGVAPGSEGTTKLTSTGGGKAGRNATDSGGPGGSGGGGSGGPGGPGAGSSGAGNTPPFSPPQGNPGSATPTGRGGGGGASAAGSSSSPGAGASDSSVYPGSTFSVGGNGGGSGGSASANTGNGGDGNATPPGGNGGSGVVRVVAPAQPYAFYGSGVWDMNAVYTYVKAGKWS